jgi:hypothetical protein
MKFSIGSFMVVGCAFGLLGACDGSPSSDAAVDTGIVDAVRETGAMDVTEIASDAVDAPNDVIALDTGTDSAADVVDAMRADAGPSFSCLGSVPRDPSTGSWLTLSFNVNRSLDGSPYAGVLVKACPRSQVTCSTPDSSGPTNAAGDVTLLLPLTSTGWDGYFEITGSTAYPTRYFTVVPLTSSDTSTSTSLVDMADMDAIAGALGVTLDPTRGHVLSNTFDCTLNTAAHVVNTISPSVMGNTSAYLQAGVPDATATETDDSGIWGSLNVPEGAITVTATVAGNWIGETTISVRRGFASTFGMRPMPTP